MTAGAHNPSAADTTNAAWSARDLSVVWHPCTQMKDHEQLPLIPIRRGQGVWLEDYDGKRYLDAISSWWVNIFGHSHPHINAAIKTQLDELEHVLLAGFTHAPVVELSEQLLRMAPPGLQRCFYADNGSSAVEIALKMSFHCHRNHGHANKHRFVTLTNSYHGETLGALAVGNVPLYKETYAPLLMDAISVRTPDSFCREPGESERDYAQRAFEPMAETLANHVDEICAVIVEPLVQCAGGMRMYHPVYLELLRAACDRYGIHLIADEIAVGFGRTGTMFACEQAAITPDFLLLGKGLTGGYLPLSTVLTTATIYEAFYANWAAQKAFLHSHSYTGNPLACRAALATLELFAASDVLQNNRVLSTLMLDAVATLRDHPHVADVRQHGMILAIELARDKASRTPFPAAERRGLRVYRHGLDHGVILRPLGNVVYFMPPYVITPDEIALLGRVACDAINLATR